MTKTVNNLFTYYVPENTGSHTQEALLRLYQPIIGMQATTLYLTFLEKILKQDVQSYFELLQISGMSVDELSQAFAKLEALRLIRTYENREQVAVYELIPPLTKEAFLGEPLFVHLLENYCEAEYVNQIREQVQAQLLPLKQLGELKNISATFKEIFGENMTAQKVDTLKSQTVFQEKQGVFNWEAFVVYLPSLVRDKISTTKELQHVVEELAEFNELDAKEMAEVFTKSYQESRGIITPASLKEAATTYSLKKLQNANRMQSSDVTTDKKNDESSVPNVGSETTRQAFYQMKTMRSSDYVRLLTRNYTPKDKEIIENLHYDYHFSEEVINVLLDYAYKTSKPRGLNWKFIEAIAQQWSKAQVASAEDAYKAIVEFASARKDYQQKRKFTGNKARRTEIVPDFDAKSDIVEDDDKLQEEFAAIMSSLKEGK